LSVETKDLPEFPKFPSLVELAAYIDASHATDLRTRRSVTVSFFLAGGALAFKSKLQPTVATSSTVSEFIAAVLAAKIAKYLRSILIELGFPPSGPTLLYEDNKAATNRPTERSRHIDIQNFAIQEWRQRGDIKLAHIPGVINLAELRPSPPVGFYITDTSFVALWATMDRARFEFPFTKSCSHRTPGTWEQPAVVLHFYLLTTTLSLGEGVAAHICIYRCPGIF
jgi:hypothetical protein